MLWILGTLVVLLRLAVGTWQVGRLAKNGDRVDDGEWLSLTQRLAKGLGITRPLTLLRGDSLAVPVTWGVVYPAVLLPSESNEWPEERRRFVLVHEMAHVKRFDALTQLLAQVTISILWFDPFLWYAAHRMRVEREHACDDYVLRDGTTPSLYAGELLEMVQSIGTPRRENTAPAFAALAMARRSEFEGRMLAILDKRQDRNTLGRRSTVLASIALGLLVLPLAALRPFASAAPVPVTPVIVSSLTSARTAAPKSSNHVPLSDIACDSVMSIPVDRAKREVKWTHLHVLEDDDDNLAAMEFLTYDQARCAQAIVRGPATFEGDQLVSLAEGSTAYIREISGAENRLLRIEPAGSGKFSYAASVNGKNTPYDEATRRWVARLFPEALKETAVDAPARVARWVVRGGTDRALIEIRRINNLSARRVHYLALIEGSSLNERELAAIRDHVMRYMPRNSSDRKAVLAKLGSRGVTESVSASSLKRDLRGSNTSGDSASLLTQAAASDDPAMILMALQGAKEISSDEDRRVLLQTIAPRALGKRDATLRKAFFEATSEMTSDTDLRVVFTSILPHAQSDPEITLAIFRAVAKQMTSDEDKRVTLTGAVSYKLLRTPAIREAFMVAARSIESDSDFSVLMQAALRQ
jgi:beta-lactamase regulating signal transducer with metallopeptidase domain